MIKTIDEIKELEDVKAFETSYAEWCAKACHHIENILACMRIDIGAEFVNLDAIKAEINNLIMNKLAVKIPEQYFRITVVATAEKDKEQQVSKKRKK